MKMKKIKEGNEGRMKEEKNDGGDLMKEEKE